MVHHGAKQQAGRFHHQFGELEKENKVAAGFGFVVGADGIVAEGGAGKHPQLVVDAGEAKEAEVLGQYAAGRIWLAGGFQLLLQGLEGGGEEVHRYVIN